MDDVWKGLTLLVGAGIVYIAYQQYQIAREKFRLELFEKRFAVFAATRRLLSIALTEANVSIPQLFEFRAAVAEATFLFESDITDYLDEVDRKALRLHTTDTLIREKPDAENRSAIIDENSQLIEWLTNQLVVLKVKFAPYLKFRTWI